MVRFAEVCKGSDVGRKFLDSCLDRSARVRSCLPFSDAKLLPLGVEFEQPLGPGEVPGVSAVT